eukprot:gb/GECG01001626.1/.p1 GENE.gb/GECG01001626.1/~~gb/GECG01001626.1/.p1  ORF type:complete len:127 (+),score=22.14 gb/GECG01001626.1/:1-381(+)
MDNTNASNCSVYEAFAPDEEAASELHVYEVTKGQEEALKHIRSFLREFRQMLLDRGCNIDDFQGFEEELNSLPGKYDKSKNGCLWIGYLKSQKQNGIGVPAGCIAVREHVSTTYPVLQEMQTRMFT